MANLFNSTQPKWIYFCNEEAAATKQQGAVPVGNDPQQLQIKSEGEGAVNLILHQAGHAGVLPVIGARKDISITFRCVNGDEAFIIKTFMIWVCEAGTDAISASNQRFLSFTGKNASVSKVPAMFEGKITAITVDFSGDA